MSKSADNFCESLRLFSKDIVDFDVESPKGGVDTFDTALGGVCISAPLAVKDTENPSHTKAFHEMKKAFNTMIEDDLFANVLKRTLNIVVRDAKLEYWAYIGQYIAEAMLLTSDYNFEKLRAVILVQDKFVDAKDHISEENLMFLQLKIDNFLNDCFVTYDPLGKEEKAIIRQAFEERARGAVKFPYEE